jgi:hypothetical protein
MRRHGDDGQLQFDARMVEIEDKLNGLIGFIDGNRKPE